MTGTQHAPALRASTNSVTIYLLGPPQVVGHLQHNVLIISTLVTSIDLSIHSRPKAIGRHKSLVLVKMLKGKSIPTPPVMCAEGICMQESPSLTYHGLQVPTIKVTCRIPTL